MAARPPAAEEAKPDQALEGEYLDLIDLWREAETNREAVIDRFLARSRAVAGDDPVFMEWDAADDETRAAKEAMRHFLFANRRRMRA